MSQIVTVPAKPPVISRPSVVKAMPSAGAPLRAGTVHRRAPVSSSTIATRPSPEVVAIRSSDGLVTAHGLLLQVNVFGAHSKRRPSRRAPVTSQTPSGAPAGRHDDGAVAGRLDPRIVADPPPEPLDDGAGGEVPDDGAVYAPPPPAACRPR